MQHRLSDWPANSRATARPSPPTKPSRRRPREPPRPTAMRPTVRPWPRGRPEPPICARRATAWRPTWPSSMAPDGRPRTCAPGPRPASRSGRSERPGPRRTSPPSTSARRRCAWSAIASARTWRPPSRPKRRPGRRSGPCRPPISKTATASGPPSEPPARHESACVRPMNGRAPPSGPNSRPVSAPTPSGSRCSWSSRASVTPGSAASPRSPASSLACPAGRPRRATRNASTGGRTRPPMRPRPSSRRWTWPSSRGPRLPRRKPRPDRAGSPSSGAASTNSVPRTRTRSRIMPP